MRRTYLIAVIVLVFLVGYFAGAAEQPATAQDTLTNVTLNQINQTLQQIARDIGAIEECVGQSYPYRPFNCGAIDVTVK